MGIRRELGTGERWVRGALSPLDIVPGVGGLTKFSSAVRVANLGTDMAQFGLKTGIKSSIKQEIKHVGDMTVTAGKQASTRLKSAGAAMKDASNVAKDKLAKGAVGAGKVMDSAVTQAKNIPSSRQMLAMDGAGNVRMPVQNTHTFENKIRATLSKAEGVNVGGKGAKSIEFKNVGEYFNYINEIGKRTDLSTDQKLAKIHEAYKELGEIKGDVTVVSDKKYLKPEGFGPNGRMIIDWPNKMGFIEDKIQPINRNNYLPEQWDRIGGKAGENFTTLPDNELPYSYDQRAIPYLENPEARHVGTFANEPYFNAIDSIKDGNFEELNKLVVANGKDPISNIEFDRFKAHYDRFLDNTKSTIGDIDATYGLKGNAAPWSSSSTGEVLMTGGAEQIVTPLNAEMLEMIGVISNY
ncbi:hypothetical protein WMZ97_06070 [Lentibacillus sp. N15]|uniref:hypothetical protein n=1 Tax=Lentibacillus songyuanensis TaxID=3136161 RepID=UPI0031BAA3C4